MEEHGAEEKVVGDGRKKRKSICNLFGVDRKGDTLEESSEDFITTHEEGGGISLSDCD